MNSKSKDTGISPVIRAPCMLILCCCMDGATINHHGYKHLFRPHDSRAWQNIGKPLQQGF